jgi:feruloyl-CoA synthase
VNPGRQAPFRPVRVGGCIDARVEMRADGSTLLQSREALGEYPQRVSDLLARWARSAPERTFVAKRGADGVWRRISYQQMLARARRVGQALLDAGLSAERPLAILSGNDLEHATLMMAAAWVGVPCVSVSTAYSLVSPDHERLRHVLRTTRPGMVYAADQQYTRAIQAAVPEDVAVVLGEGAIKGRVTRAFSDLRPDPGAQVDAARDATGPDTIVKYLFTSGSTKMPKAVITTNRMLCSNQQMLRQCMAFLADEPPVLVDWLPWSHTFGGNHNLGIALYNGGTFHIDDGRPTRGGIGETIRNLIEISPTIYFNVPKGLEEVAQAMEGNKALRRSLFSRVKAFMFAAAGLSQTTWDALERHAVATCGERIRIVTSLGMTETAPSALFLVGTHARSGYVGLPCPGVDVKLVQVDGKTEVRFKGPNVMPGYLNEPGLTAAAFDEEGFYCTGDAVRWVDPDDLTLGLAFDGRIAEDFKLSTGTFVNVGVLRARVALEGHPYVLDSVLTGDLRDELGVLVFPRLDECLALSGLDASASAEEILHHPRVREWFAGLATRLYASGTGSANRITRMHLLVEPPSVAHGELTDKGSINQRAVLAHRAPVVEALYEGRPGDPWLILPAQREAAPR